MEKKSIFGPIRFCLVVCVVLLANSFSCSQSVQENERGWQLVPEILDQIIPPSIPAIDFLVTDFGAKGDGNSDCTDAFSLAINECSKAGGGRVVVPAGKFLTGAIHLQDNVNLHLSDSAVVLFSTDLKKYLPVVYTRYEGVECMNYSPFIYAFEKENIAITGTGILDGQASTENWWSWKGRSVYGWSDGEPNGIQDVKLLEKMANNDMPVEERIFGEGHYLRTNFIQFNRCKNILIDGLTIHRSPMWVIHPVLCENVTVQNVNVSSHGPNNDGCNPESSRDVLIQDCTFDTGDDCIAIKSGRNTDGRRVNVASENIVIRRCVMKDGHGGVVIGSEISGDVRNVYAEDCMMDSPRLDRALRIKTNSMRGGVAEKIYMRNIQIGEVSDAVIKINFNYGEGDVGDHTPIVRDIYVTNVTSKKSKYALSLSGYERSPISNLNLYNCRFEGVKSGNILEYYQNLSMKDVYINGKLQQ